MVLVCILMSGTNFTIDNAKKVGLKGNVWSFSSDYNPILFRYPYIFNERNVI